VTYEATGPIPELPTMQCTRLVPAHPRPPYQDCFFSSHLLIPPLVNTITVTIAITTSRAMSAVTLKKGAVAVITGAA
jgi:hypothetical protein